MALTILKRDYMRSKDALIADRALLSISISGFSVSNPLKATAHLDTPFSVVTLSFLASPFRHL
jgi:hypothetical protein